MRRSTLNFISVLTILGVLLAGEYLLTAQLHVQWLDLIRDEIVSFFTSKETECIAVVCLCVYIITFFVLERRLKLDAQGWCSRSANLWLGVLAALALARYALAYQSASSSSQLLVLLAGIALCKGAWVWARWPAKEEMSTWRIALMIKTLVLLLSGAACWRPQIVQVFQYRGQTRWSGPWENPNTFGMLMGLGIVLAGGQLVQSLKFKVQRHASAERRALSAAVWWWLKFVFLLAAALAMSVGLLKSYSRGAWLAVLCGLSCLVFQAVRNSLFQAPRTVQGIRRNCVSLVFAMCALAVLTFWQFRQTERVVARRAFSVGNVKDFSWRNRVAAYAGALQIIADKPWFGSGWNQPGRVYDQFYRSAKVNEGMAIQLNDYFMLGASLGLPALFCFGAYLWLSCSRGAKAESRERLLDGRIQKSEIRNPKSEFAELDWLKTTCRGGAIVLLVGFWFDGGLFKMATAAPFWILLELGRSDLNSD